MIARTNNFFVFTDDNKLAIINLDNFEVKELSTGIKYFNEINLEVPLNN